MSYVEAKVPVKVILSGEHAVVYGSPAIACAVDQFVIARIRWRTDDRYTFTLPQFQAYLNFDYSTLINLFRQIDIHYQQFLQGQRSIVTVLPQSFYVVPYALVLVANQLQLSTIPPLEVELHIGSPIGSGMGTSAAVALSIITASYVRFGHQPLLQDLFRLAMMVESLIHGHPSGIDPAVCLYGGAILFEKGQITHISPPIWHPIFLYTGKPESSTGECVTYVRQHFGVSHPIWEEFKETTQQIYQQLYQPISPDLLNTIRRNHRLLTQIGVVPQRVQKIIQHVEEQGGAAKICGAGAVKGENGGIVLAIGAKDYASIAKQFNLELLSVQPTLTGVEWRDTNLN